MCSSCYLGVPWLYTCAFSPQQLTPCQLFQPTGVSIESCPHQHPLCLILPLFTCTCLPACLLAVLMCPLATNNRGAAGHASHQTQPQAAAGVVVVPPPLLLLAAAVVVAGRVSTVGHRRSMTNWHRCVQCWIANPMVWQLCLVVPCSFARLLYHLCLRPAASLHRHPAK